MNKLCISNNVSVVYFSFQTLFSENRRRKCWRCWIFKISRSTSYCLYESNKIDMFNANQPHQFTYRLVDADAGDLIDVMSYPAGSCLYVAESVSAHI